MKTKYKTDLKLGEKYRDQTTGTEGHLVAIHFYEHGCERGTLRFLDKNNVPLEMSFDAPELVSVASGEVCRAVKTGGPARAEGRRSY
jgi:hypothetical protein